LTGRVNQEGWLGVNSQSPMTSPSDFVGRSVGENKESGEVSSEEDSPLGRCGRGGSSGWLRVGCG